jgi:hypothetical protein
VKILSSLAVIASFIGAYYWYVSTTVPIKRWGENEPLPFPDEHQRQEMLNRTAAMNTLWLGGMLDAARETARRNKIAALWTAVALGLNGALALLQAC